MSNKKIEKIMYYDEAQKAWIVDVMEVEANDQDSMNQIVADNNESKGECAYV